MRHLAPSLLSADLMIWRLWNIDLLFLVKQVPTHVINTIYYNNSAKSSSGLEVTPCTVSSTTTRQTVFTSSSICPTFRFTSLHFQHSRGHFGSEEVLDLVAVPLQPRLVQEDVLDALGGYSVMSRDFTTIVHSLNAPSGTKL